VSELPEADVESERRLDGVLQLFPEAERAQWALHEVLSPTTWRRGRITLLGDSVSPPMLYVR
jgi:hypothetical protein